MWHLDYKESWALKNWCFWTVVLEKTNSRCSINICWGNTFKVTDIWAGVKGTAMELFLFLGSERFRYLMLTETTGRLTSVLCRGSASLPPQSTARFLPVHFAPRRPRSMANPQLSCKKTSSIRVEKNAFISCQLVHNQTNFASSGLEPSSKYSCVGNPFVDDWMQRGDSGLTFDSQKRGSYFLQCLGPRTGLHSNLVFIGTRTSLKKHSKYAHICYLLCSHNSPLMSGKNKQNFSARLLCSLVLVTQLCLTLRPHATPWTVALQAPLSLGFPSQEYWSG